MVGDDDVFGGRGCDVKPPLFDRRSTLENSTNSVIGEEGGVLPDHALLKVRAADMSLFNEINVNEC